MFVLYFLSGKVPFCTISCMFVMLCAMLYLSHFHNIIDKYFSLIRYAHEYQQQC